MPTSRSPTSQPRGFTKRRVFLRLALCVVAILVGAGVWLPTLHMFYVEDAEQYDQEAVPPRARALLTRHLRLWEDVESRRLEQARMRRSNAEWDFMGRTFLVAALANLSLREPKERPRYLAVIDQIVDDTIRVEKNLGKYHFLMPYASQGRFIQKPARSIFVDGEIALMLGARRLVEDSPRFKVQFAQLVATMASRLAAAPMLCGESYPDECWMFCNAVAMVVLRISDVLDGTNHDPLIGVWLETVTSRLLDEKTGLLVSAFTLDGRPTHGPEGSSIWFVIHCLRALDVDLARDQYERARREIGRVTCGFGYAVEWPSSWVGDSDIDSGAVIPILGVSAGSSGMAPLAAQAMGDRDYLASVLATMDFAAFPSEVDGGVRNCASNQVGDAVLLYSLVQGPLWQRIARTK